MLARDYNASRVPGFKGDFSIAAVYLYHRPQPYSGSVSLSTAVPLLVVIVYLDFYIC